MAYLLLIGFYAVLYVEPFVVISITVRDSSDNIVLIAFATQNTVFLYHALEMSLLALPCERLHLVSLPLSEVGDGYLS